MFGLSFFGSEFGDGRVAFVFEALEESGGWGLEAELLFEAFPSNYDRYFCLHKLVL